MNPKALSSLVLGVRAESGKSLNTALGIAERDSIVYQLQSKQEQLYADYDWPSLNSYDTLDIASGVRLITGSSKIAFDYINAVWCSTDDTEGFSEVGYGIGPNEYNCNPVGGTGWPISKWMVSSTAETQIELWPTPSQAGKLRFVGRRALTPMVADADLSTLDGTMLVLFVAADILAAQKAETASIRLNQAQRYARNLARRETNNKRAPFVLGGGVASGNVVGAWGQRSLGLRPGIDYIPMSG